MKTNFKMKHFFLFLLIISSVGITNAEDKLKRNLIDYIGRYTFLQENANIDNVVVDIQNDSTLKVEANVGTASLIHVSGDEFKIAEYDGLVTFKRDSINFNVVGVKVIVPVASIEAEGKKE